MLFKVFSFILLLVLTYSSNNNKQKVVPSLTVHDPDLSWTTTPGTVHKKILSMQPESLGMRMTDEKSRVISGFDNDLQKYFVGANGFNEIMEEDENMQLDEVYEDFENLISDDECDATDYKNFLESHMKQYRRKSSAGEAATSRLLKKSDQTWNFNFICEKDEIQKVEETKRDAYTSLLDLYTRIMYCKNNTNKDLQKAESLITKERFSKKELESIENFAYHRSLQNAPYSQFKISEKQTSRKNKLIDMFELAKQDETKEELIPKFAEETFYVSEEDQKRNDMLEEFKKTMVFLSMLDEIEAKNEYLYSEEVTRDHIENQDIHSTNSNAKHYHLHNIQRSQNINLSLN